MEKGLFEGLRLRVPLSLLPPLRPTLLLSRRLRPWSPLWLPRCLRAALLLLVFQSLTNPLLAAELPRVASINLCTDQLLLRVADPDQIESLSWLASDPADSMLADEARAYPQNFGSAEEVLALRPDVVLGGQFTSAFTKTMLEDLGFRVVTVAPANSVAEIGRNLRVVGEAIGREDRAEALIVAMRARVARIERERGTRHVPGIVVRPGGFTVGSGTLADDLMRLAGVDNIAARRGLDIWGSLSVESLLTSRPRLLIVSGYRRDQPSLANGVFAHPVVRTVNDTAARVVIDAATWACGIPDSLRSAELLARAVSHL